MKKMFFAALFVAVSIFSVGCNKDNTTEPLANTMASSTDDAAYNISTELSSESSGAVDQVGDAFDLAFPGGLAKMQANFVDTTFKNKVWDDVNKLWTVTVDRSNKASWKNVTNTFKRTYTIQFLNKDGQPMKYWKVGSDTAYTVKFKILNGESYFTNGIVSHRLISLTADLTITNANQKNVTINGTMRRQGSDTISNKVGTRTHNFTLNLNYQNVVGPRTKKLQLQNKLSGTVSGNYTASVTFQSGDIYNEKQINKDFTINLDGTGNYNLNLGGGKYKGNLGFCGFSK
jgi:hypothetical protein